MKYNEDISLIYAVYFKEKIDYEIQEYNTTEQLMPLIIPIASNDKLTEWLFMNYSNEFKINYTNVGFMYNYFFTKKSSLN